MTLMKPQDLPQEMPTSQLPQRGDVLEMSLGAEERTAQLLTYDSELDVWTVRDATSNEVFFICVKDDLSWHYVTIEDSQ